MILFYMIKSLEHSKEKEPRLFLIDLVNRSGEVFLKDVPMLEKLERGEASRDEWQEFAVQRYLAALPFEELLEGGAKRPP